jgi:hypothetical protein
VLTEPTYSPGHMLGGMAPESDTRHLSHKIRSSYMKTTCCSAGQRAHKAKAVFKRDSCFYQEQRIYPEISMLATLLHETVE